MNEPGPYSIGELHGKVMQAIEGLSHEIALGRDQHVQCREEIRDCVKALAGEVAKVKDQQTRMKAYMTLVAGIALAISSPVIKMFTGK